MQPQWLRRQIPCSDKLARRRSRRLHENDRAQFEDTLERPSSARSTSPVNPNQTESRRMSQTRVSRCRDGSERSPYQDAENELTPRLVDFFSNRALREHLRAWS